jgi:hypothetical protein
MRHARLSKADRMEKKNSRLISQTKHMIADLNPRRPVSPERNTIGVRTSLMIELDKKITSIAQTINCITVRPYLNPYSNCFRWKMKLRARHRSNSSQEPIS